MGGVGSGGANRLTQQEHRLKNTFRLDRHAALSAGPPAPIAAADRRKALRGLSPPARTLAAELLDAFDGWDAAAIEVLRSYAESCVRLRALQDANGDGHQLHREIRTNLSLLKALHLETAR